MSLMGEITTGPLGGILHVNRQFIAMNAKDGGDRPVFTIKPNGPSSQPVYCRDAAWDGPTRAVGTLGQLSCGAKAWIAIPANTKVNVYDPMSFKEAKAA